MIIIKKQKLLNEKIVYLTHSNANWVGFKFVFGHEETHGYQSANATNCLQHLYKPDTDFLIAKMWRYNLSWLNYEFDNNALKKVRALFPKNECAFFYFRL